MGLLDNIVSTVADVAGKSSSASQLQTVWSWVQQQGGIDALIQKFNQGGLASVLSSWIGNGNNQSISHEDIKSAFSQQDLQSLAEKLGTDITGASGTLAQLLPVVIDKLSPQGKLHSQASSAGKTDLSSLLAGIFGK